MFDPDGFWLFGAVCYLLGAASVIIAAWLGPRLRDMAREQSWPVHPTIDRELADLVGVKRPPPPPTAEAQAAARAARRRILAGDRPCYTLDQLAAFAREDGTPRFLRTKDAPLPRGE